EPSWRATYEIITTVVSQRNDVRELRSGNRTKCRLDLLAGVTPPPSSYDKPRRRRQASFTALRLVRPVCREREAKYTGDVGNRVPSRTALKLLVDGSSPILVLRRWRQRLGQQISELKAAAGHDNEAGLQRESLDGRPTSVQRPPALRVYIALTYHRDRRRVVITRLFPPNLWFGRVEWVVGVHLNAVAVM